MSKDFTSYNNDKVINIGDNHAPIYTSSEDSAETNQAHINNSGIHNSTVTNNIYQNEKPQESKQTSRYLIWATTVAIIIFAMYGIVMFALSKQQSTSNTNTSASNISLITNVQNNNANSTTNIQPNVMLQNINIVAGNSERATSKSNTSKLSSNKKKQAINKTVSLVSPKKPETSTDNYWTSRCSSQVNGCPPNKEK
jgi:hypothetical protein